MNDPQQPRPGDELRAWVPFIGAVGTAVLVGLLWALGLLPK